MSNGMIILATLGCLIVSGFGILGLSCLLGYMIGDDDNSRTFWNWIVSCLIFAACATIYIITTNVKGAQL